MCVCVCVSVEKERDSDSLTNSLCVTFQSLLHHFHNSVNLLNLNIVTHYIIYNHHHDDDPTDPDDREAQDVGMVPLSLRNTATNDQGLPQFSPLPDGVLESVFCWSLHSAAVQ